MGELLLFRAAIRRRMDVSQLAGSRHRLRHSSLHAQFTAAARHPARMPDRVGVTREQSPAAVSNGLRSVEASPGPLLLGSVVDSG
jgi:hypothetical protein